MTDIVVMKSMEVDGSVVELVHNLHCEHYELQIDGIPVFNCKEYRQAEYEYEMEKS